MFLVFNWSDNPSKPMSTLDVVRYMNHWNSIILIVDAGSQLKRNVFKLDESFFLIATDLKIRE